MQKVMNETKTPNTVPSLEKDLRALGVTDGMTILVHSSLSSLGWTNSGAMAVIQALMNVVTQEGNIVMPAQSGDWSDPEEWEAPPVPEEWRQIIRDTMPAYDPRMTPTRNMGQIAELFRTFPDVVRSSHPAVSFAAWGKDNEHIIAGHELNFGLGEGSPLKTLYNMNGSVLFLGTGYDTNTCFHLGEYRAPGFTVETKGAAVMKNGQRVWKTYKEIEFNEDVFAEAGSDFERAHHVVRRTVGSGTCKKFSLKEAVDFSEKWFTEKRGF